MAWNRLEKVGTIFSRVTGLLRAGALKDEDKPLWYELYKRIPPVDEPRFDRPVKDIKVRKIFYPEDLIRAKFHKVHGSQVKENLADFENPTKCQQFIKLYNSLKEKETPPEDGLFEKTAEMLGLIDSRYTASTEELGFHSYEKHAEIPKKETLVSTFKKAKEKYGDTTSTSTEVNIKDIFKD